MKILGLIKGLALPPQLLKISYSNTYSNTCQASESDSVFFFHSIFSDQNDTSNSIFFCHAVFPQRSKLSAQDAHSKPAGACNERQFGRALDESIWPRQGRKRETLSFVTPFICSQYTLGYRRARSSKVPGDDCAAPPGFDSTGARGDQ